MRNLSKKMRRFEKLRSFFAVLFLFPLALLLFFGNGGKANGLNAMPNGKNAPPCTNGLETGQSLFSADMAQKLLRSPKELQDYIKAHSNKRYWGLSTNLSLISTDNVDRPYVLELKIPKGAINPGNKDAPRGGAGYHWTPELPQNTVAACLSYAVWFPADFDFVKGGKLPGLFGGMGPSGGKLVTGMNGFSTRFMWRRDGQGEVYAYIVGAKTRGISLDRGAFMFKRGAWTKLVQEVVLNSPQKTDGRVRVWVDGKLVIDRRGLVFRTVEDVTINGVMAHVFFGGKDISWASSKDTLVRMTPFELRWEAPQSDAGFKTGAVLLKGEK